MVEPNVPAGSGKWSHHLQTKQRMVRLAIPGKRSQLGWFECGNREPTKFYHRLLSKYIFAYIDN